MSMIRCLIVDDEPLARAGIELLLSKDPHMTIIPNRAFGKVAKAVIEKEKPDIIFLDVKMPGCTGFDLLDSLSLNPMPLVIFVTAFDEYAIDAFKAHAVDYLLKPFREDQFWESVARAKRRWKLEQLEGREKNNSTEVFQKPVYESVRGSYQIQIKEKGRLFYISFDSIKYIEACNYYVVIHTATKQYVLRESLSHLEGKSDPLKFFRIHRSTLIRIDLIQSIETTSSENYMATTMDGKTFKISRSKKQALTTLLAG